MIRAAISLSLAALIAGAASADITGASYAEPTDAYGHGAIAGGEYAALTIEIAPDRLLGIGTSQNVYEDTAPRLADLDGDGTPEVITVISYFDAGAAIRIFDEVADPDHPNGSTVAIALETAPIGQRHRWLSIAGIADLDGDGRMEIAYVDRPHLAKALRVVEVSRSDGTWVLRDEAVALGLTNHRLRAPMIEGGIFDCGMGPEILTADAEWQRVIATRLVGSALLSRDVGAYDGPQSVACP